MAKNTVYIDYLGRSASAVKAANDVAVANEKAAGRASTAFDKSTSKIGSAFSRLGNELGNFGVPFSGALNAVGNSFDKTTTKGKTFGSTMSKIGGVELLAAGAGLALIGKSSVNAARDFETAQARLQTSVKNTGESFHDAEPGITKTDDALRKLGFTDTDTESALAKLTGATHDVSKAQSLMSLATDIARAKHVDLGDATQLLVNIEGGRLRGLAALGISTKDATGKTIDAAEAFRRLNAVVGGQGIAFMDTFDGKMAAVKAQADHLEVTLGEALIPKIESLASGAVGGVQGFENLNAATSGWLGKITLAGAAVPAAVFAVEKLDAAGVALAGSFSRAGTILGVTTAETEAATAANTDLAASATAAAEAEGGLGVSAAAGVPAVAGLGVGILAAAAALLTFQHNAKTGDNPLELPSFVPKNIGPIPLNSFNTRNSSRDTDEEKQGAAFVGTQHATAQAADLAGESIGKVQRELTVYTLALLKGASAAKATNEVFGKVGANPESLAGFTSGVNEATKGLDAGQKAQLRYSLALQTYQADVAPGAHVSQARQKTDAGELKAANAALVGIQGQVNSALGTGAAAADKGKFAYLGLADSVKTASDALSAITTAAFAPIQIGISVDTAQTSVTSALDALNNPDTGASGGGGGGGGQTATAAALDATQKQYTLADAQTAVTTSTDAVTAAQKNYQEVLRGVSRSSAEGQAAIEAYARAQDAAKSSSLDLIDAQNALTQAKDAAANAGHLAQEGATGASLGLQGAQLDLKDANAALIRARESQDPETIARAQIAVGDAQLRVAQATDANAAAQKQLSEVGKKNSKENEDVTRAQIGVTEAQLNNRDSATALHTAQQTLNDTLNGYPASSQAAKTAQDQLTTAQNQSRDAVLNLYRAQADLDGKLTASSGAAAAGKKLDDLTTRVDNAKGAILDLATQAGAADLAAGHSFAHSILVEMGVLQSYAAANPLLAHVFGDALTTLQTDFENQLIKQAPDPFHNTSSYTPPPAITGSGRGGRKHATGGSTGAGPSGGFPAIVHPNEYVIQAKAVQKYGTHMMDSINLGSFGTGGRVGGGASYGGGEFHYHQNGPVYGIANLHAEIRKAAQEFQRNNGRTITTAVR